jgi:hypothetical protein
MAAEVYFKPCNFFLWNTGPAQESTWARNAPSPFSQVPHEEKSEVSCVILVPHAVERRKVFRMAMSNK